MFPGEMLVLSSKKKYIYIFGPVLETIYHFLEAFHQPFVMTLKEVTVIGDQFAKTGDQEGVKNSPLCDYKQDCVHDTHIHSVDS